MKKVIGFRFLIVTSILFMLSASFVMTAPVSSAGDSGGMDGQGTVANPYIIRDIIDLDNLRNDLSAHYILGNDIDAHETSSWNGGTGFIPIAMNSSHHYFRGTLNGQGYSIDGLHIALPLQNYVGLFARISFDAEIISLNCINLNVSGKYYVGGLVGYNEGYISHSHVSGNLSGYEFVGGLTGANNGVVSFSDSNVNLLGETSIGGLTGSNTNTIVQSNSTVEIQGLSGIGGLAGVNHASIIDSHATITSIAGNRVGGLVGYNSGSITRGFANSIIVGSIYIGGLVGTNRGIVNESFAMGQVSSANWVGGLIGENYGLVTYSYFKGDVNGFNYIAGGIVGENVGHILNCNSSGYVNGDNTVGGLVGSNRGIVSQSYSTADVNGTQTVGGVIGDNYHLAEYYVMLSESYSTGNVTGDRWVGGLIGSNNGYIDSSYSVSRVEGNEMVGGLVGTSYEAMVTKSYWDIESSGQNWSHGGTGKVSADMKNSNLFKNADWDFDDTWWMVDGETYPLLRYQGIQAEAGDDVVSIIGNEVQFDAGSTPGTIVNNTWEFQYDGALIRIYDDVSPSYELNIIGMYNVTLYVQNDNGEWGYDTLTVNVIPLTNPELLHLPDTDGQETILYQSLVVAGSGVTWNYESDASFIEFSVEDGDLNISGTPAIGDQGTYFVNISFTKIDDGGSNYLNYTLTIAKAWAPTITSDEPIPPVHGFLKGNDFLHFVTVNESSTFTYTSNASFPIHMLGNGLQTIILCKMDGGPFYLNVTATSTDGKMSVWQNFTVDVVTKVLATGVVKNSAGNPVAGAAILLGDEILTYTDANGTYSILIDEGEHVLEVQKAGFTFSSMVIEALSGDLMVIEDAVSTGEESSEGDDLSVVPIVLAAIIGTFIGALGMLFVIRRF